MCEIFGIFRDVYTEYRSGPSFHKSVLQNTFGQSYISLKFNVIDRLQQVKVCNLRKYGTNVLNLRRSLCFKTVVFVHEIFVLNEADRVSDAGFDSNSASDVN